MSRFIEPLESRIVLSATADTLTADLAALKVPAGTAVVDFLALQKTLTADFKTVATDLKGSAKTNAPLLKTLKADGKTALAKIKSDGLALLKAGVKAKRAAADGKALLKKTSSKLTAKVQADITALGSATTTPLTNLQNDSQHTGIGTDLDALTAANPTNTALATDAAKLKADAVTDGTALVTAAQNFATAIATLNTDLSTLV